MSGSHGVERAEGGLVSYENVQRVAGDLQASDRRLGGPRWPYVALGAAALAVGTAAPGTRVRAEPGNLPASEAAAITGESDLGAFAVAVPAGQAERLRAVVAVGPDGEVLDRQAVAAP